jgi:hypothetical protein
MATSLRCISSVTFFTPRTDSCELDRPALLVARLHFTREAHDTSVDADVNAESAVTVSTDSCASTAV